MCNQFESSHRLVPLTFGPLIMSLTCNTPIFPYFQHFKKSWYAQTKFEASNLITRAFFRQNCRIKLCSNISSIPATGRYYG